MMNLIPTPPLSACESYLELVEAQNVGFLREIPSHLGYRVAPTTTHGNFGGMYSLVNIDHECVEMNPAFTSYGRWKSVVE